MKTLVSCDPHAVLEVPDAVLAAIVARDPMEFMNQVQRQVQEGVAEIVEQ
jgi:hypothetical protein